MINQEQTIPCPTCQTKIPFDAHQLLMGAQFACPGCHAVIGLPKESRPLVHETIQKFEKLKQEMGKGDKKN